MSESILLDVTKSFDCDTLVLGGGCAGFSAAVCAARHGANVILADINGYLGGTATAGLVGPFMTSYDADGKEQIIRGFFDEFVRRMESVGGATHPSKAMLGTSYTAYRIAGHRNLTAFNAETYKRVAEQMCIEAGVKLMYHMMFIKSETENGIIKAAYFATKSGIYKITAKNFVDASGDGDLAADGGVPMIFGDGEGEVQPASLFFTVKDVDKAEMDAHMQAHVDDMNKKFYMQEIIEEREKGTFPIWRAKIMLFESFGGQWLVNMSQIDDVDANDPEQVTKAEIEGREQIEYILTFLRKYAAGCKNISLVRSADSLGIRESRRIVGEHTATADEASVSYRYPDSVFCCSNSLDIHKKGYVEYVERKSTEPYYIPYRSLLPKNVNNLIVAGRCISTDRAVMAAVRVMPPCFAMGQAAGTAAALSIKNGVSPKELNAGLLVDTLVKDGVYLP